MHDEKSVIKSAGIISTATFISRILGFIRDALTASFFGMSVVSDAFFVAQRIPNLLRMLLAEGALSSAFIPVFTESLQQEEGEKKAKELSNTVFTFLLIVLLIVTALGMIFSRQVVQIITLSSGSFNSVASVEKFELTVKLTRIVFPFVIFIGIGAQVMGILNSLHKYFFPAIAPAVNNVCLIFSLYFIAPLMGVKIEERVLGLAIGVVIGGAFHLFTQIPCLIKNGFGFSFSFNIKHPGLTRIFKLMGPAVFGLAVTQINMFVDTMLAWKLGDGAISALYYSNRLVQLPMGVFGVAIATASFPVLSKLKAQGDFAKMKDIIGSSIRFLALITFPASIGLVSFGIPIIRLLFEHGKFGSDATRAAYFALIFYSIGIFFFGVVKLIGPVFYAFDKPSVPVSIASKCMILNIFLNIIFMQFLSHGGLALATSVSGILNSMSLYIALKKEIGALKTKELVNELGKIFFSSVIMGIAVYFYSHFLNYNFIQYKDLLWFKFIHVFSGLFLAVITYSAFCYIFRVGIFLRQFERILKKIKK